MRPAGTRRVAGSSRSAARVQFQSVQLWLVSRYVKVKEPRATLASS